jgi:alpha-ketoglutarate-dependent taurine dioxygenase
MAVHNLMLSHYPQHMEALYRGFPYRMLDTDAQPTGRNPLLEHPVPVFARSASQLMCCFVPYYIEYAQKFGGVSLSTEDKEALQALIALTEEAGVWMEMEFRPGDIQLLNNRKILHGRADYEDYPEKARRRHLLRLWLAMPEWPEMPSNQIVHTNEEKLRWERLSVTPAG